MSTKWPKKLPELSEEQKRIKADFMKYWHEVLPRQYGIVDSFNHRFPARYARKGERVLELGAGLGEHIYYEDTARIEYYANEIMPDMAVVIRQCFPSVIVVEGDCQKQFDFPDGYFNRVIAVHVLEHLPNLPATIAEVHRLLRDDGVLVSVIPCEGGLVYTMARRISAQRLFEKRYQMPYDWFIASEHINRPAEIIEEIEKKFIISKKRFFPFFVPSISANLVIGLVAVKRP